MADEHNQSEQEYGLLTSCMDKRFVASTREAFEQATGLGSDKYWHQAFPGGAVVDFDPLGADYAASHGATKFGWQAHGDTCGGLPGRSNEETQKLLGAKAEEMKAKYPGEHFKIFATSAGIIVERI